ncbi:hypothetical protein HU200_056418 [Digitaria exilis]|uniref:Uncharacterized protein n=1 Tax=Digitaria exilis TaxID=1010633 RepID=A0A835AD74_9POAL|nr:hypothetical protein HU200_056418 [Digitaria exilis]
MLAGCSFSSSRHQMSTAQRFDILPYGFSKRSNRGDGGAAAAVPRVAAGDGAATCSFRAHPPPPVTQAVSWGAKPEPGNGATAATAAGVWERTRAVKRAHDEVAAAEEYCAAGPVVRAKRTRMAGDVDEVWFHQPIAGTVQAAGGNSHGGEEEPEEEKVFLVPSAAAFPHAAGPSLAAAKKEEFSKSPSNSPASSGGTDGGSSAPPPPELLQSRNGVPAAAHGDAGREAMELVVSLTACADSLTARNHDAANYYLARLGEMASPAGPTPMHRVAAYFAEALALRVVRTWPHLFDITPPRDLTDAVAGDDDDAMALRILNAITPIPRFLHFTLNERMLRAFDGHDRVHVIDFDIKQGLQWPGLLQSLAARSTPPAHVRITGVGESRQELQETGARLGRVAAALGLAFEFHAVVDRLEDVRLWMLHVKRGERVAVNCILAAHRLLRDDDAGGAALADFLGLARSTGAAVLLLGEHEDALNSGPWEARFARALRYYAAAFDAVSAAGLPDASAARVKAEEMFAREIRNAVAFDAGDRFERHESFAGWRRRMEEGGFQNAGIGEREVMQGRMIARMFAAGNSYSVHGQGNGEGLTLRWMDQPMYTVSAWTPVGDGGGGGSTVSASVSTTASHHSQQS